MGRGGSKHKYTRVSLAAMVTRTDDPGSRIKPLSIWDSSEVCERLGGEPSPAAPKEPGRESRARLGARLTHTLGRGAAVRGFAMGAAAPAAWEGPGCRGWVASQVPRSEERGSLQMSSGPRRRARRVSATYGGWI